MTQPPYRPHVIPPEAPLSPPWLAEVSAPLVSVSNRQSLGPVADDLREAASSLAHEVSRDVLTRLPEYAAPPHTDRRRELIENAVIGASRQFADILAGHSLMDPEVSRMYQHRGFSEGAAGKALDDLRKVLQIATRHTWAVLHAAADRRRLETDAIGAMGEALLAYVDHLDQLATRDFRQGADHFEGNPETVRPAFLRALLDDSHDRDAHHQRLTALAVCAGWTLPHRAVVIRAWVRKKLPALDPTGPVLVDETASPALLVCPEACAPDLIEQLLEADPGMRLSVTWPVGATEIAQADRWARRALDLVNLGLIPPQQVIRCDEHMPVLWLTSEPALSTRLAHRVLAPLFAERPASRAALGEVMLAWLGSRESIYHLADRLGVHPQTIRYRWRKLNALFGETLSDPDQVDAATLALRAQVPRWLIERRAKNSSRGKQIPKPRGDQNGSETSANSPET